MIDIFAHGLFINIGKSAFETEIYAQNFSGAQIEIMGASPYLNARDAGIELVLSRKHEVDAIHLYNGTLEGFCRYQGPFPLAIGFDLSRAQIRAKLGVPMMSGEPGGTGIMAIEYAFDRFENDAHYIRFQYEADQSSVRLITLGQA